MRKQKSTEAKRSRVLHGALGCALLVLAVLLIRMAVSQFAAGHAVSGCVSVLGGLLSLAAGLMLLSDLRRRHHNQED